LNEVPSSFAALLRHYRRGAGLTQEALAERAGVSARAVSDLERGLYLTPRRDTVTLLAAALGLGPADAVRLEGAVARRGRPRPSRPGDPDGRIPFGAGPGQGAGVYTAGSLPVALTGLIGREQVVDAVSALLVDP
jgi:DNA-binding XRE family transcriptional regulator